MIRSPKLGVGPPWQIEQLLKWASQYLDSSTRFLTANQIMGQMHFQIPTASKLDARIWDAAYISGIEGIPWKCDSILNDNRLTIRRSIDESGKLYCVWPVEDCNLTVLTTASLRETAEPYILPLEIARGTIFRARSRAFDWQKLGLKIPTEFFDSMNAAVETFVDALQKQTDPDACGRVADVATRYAVNSIRPLTRAFISQSFAARHQNETQLSTLMGVSLPHESTWQPFADQLRPAINTAQVGLKWHLIESDSGNSNFDFADEQIAWAEREQLRIMAGPLISLQPHSIPNWLYLIDDYDSLVSAACSYVEKTVKRYKGQVHLWSAGSGLNTPNALSLNDEQRLRMAVAIIETIRRCDDRTPVTLTIDMPFSEYLSQDTNAVSPFHFADALIRAELGISGLGLEMNIGYWPHGSLPRDLIEISDLVDRWSMLGIPLLAMMTAPCSLANDQKAFSKSEIVSNWVRPTSPEGRFSKSSLPPNGIDIFQMLLAKPSMHGVFWNHCRDAESHVYANSGAFDANDQPRGLLSALRKVRETHVM